jgi:hypothetical protein
LAEVGWAPAEDVAEVPTHARGLAFTVERVSPSGVEVLDGPGKILMLPEVDVRRREAVEEGFARHAGASHLRKGVVAELGIARVNLTNVLMDGVAQLGRLGVDACGNSQHQNQDEHGSLHGSALAGMK